MKSIVKNIIKLNEFSLLLVATLTVFLHSEITIAADNAMQAMENNKVDLTGLWVVSNRSVRGYLNQNFERIELEQILNEKGLEITEVVRPALDPSAMCLPSMPRHLGGPYPIEIIQNQDKVVQLFEYDNVFRIIYTDGRDHPDPLDDQRFMGHAVARWEDGILIVDTQNFNGKAWLAANGLPVSPQARLTEWYRLIEDGVTMEVTMKYEDTEYLTQAFWRKYFFNLKDDWDIREYLCAEGNRDNVFLQQEGLPGSLQLNDVLPE